jgi:DnaJ family protein C protein 27
VSRYISTIGVDYGVKPVTVDGRRTKVNFWDLSGHPEFFEIRNEFYKDSQGVMLCFDVSSRNSFESLETWLSEATKFGLREDAVVYLVGTKSDLPRAVSENDASQWAERRKYKYFETSAKSGVNVDQMFESLFK